MVAEGWLAKSSGEEGILFSGGRSCVSRRSLVRRLRILALRVRHQANIHATVLGTSGGSLVGIGWLVLAQTNHINLVGRNVVFRRQVLNN